MNIIDSLQQRIEGAEEELRDLLTAIEKNETKGSKFLGRHKSPEHKAAQLESGELQTKLHSLQKELHEALEAIHKLKTGGEEKILKR